MAGYEPPAEASLGSRGKRSRTFRVAKIFMAPKGKSRPGRDPGISIPSPGAPGAAQLRHLGAGDVGCAIHGPSFGRRLRRYARCRASTVLILTVGRDRESGVPDCALAAADGPELANSLCGGAARVVQRRLWATTGTPLRE